VIRYAFCSRWRHPGPFRWDRFQSACTAVTGGFRPLTVCVNGAALADTSPGTRHWSWEPDGSGLRPVDLNGGAMRHR
jgi:hypothetical protein